MRKQLGREESGRTSPPSWNLYLCYPRLKRPRSTWAPASSGEREQPIWGAQGLWHWNYQPAVYRAPEVGLQEWPLPCSATSWEHRALRSGSGVMWCWGYQWSLEVALPICGFYSHRLNQPQIERAWKKNVTLLPTSAIWLGLHRLCLHCTWTDFSCHYYIKSTVWGLLP